VISIALRWYLWWGLSYRDVEELLAARRHRRPRHRLPLSPAVTPEFIEAARLARHAPGGRWFADEPYVNVAGWWTYLYRAIDQHGQVIDVLLSARRDLAVLYPRAARRNGPGRDHHRPGPDPSAGPR
jgi:transposase-like protein